MPDHRSRVLAVILLLVATGLALAAERTATNGYESLYGASSQALDDQLRAVTDTIASANLSSAGDLERVKRQIHVARTSLKAVDFWFRYFDPVAYMRINGPLPVEWENEVFEKYEPPYRREGAGLTLAELALDEPHVDRDSLLALIQSALEATRTFAAESITTQLKDPAHFFLANRLYLLNLAAVYTTGFECPDTTRIVPELRSMLASVRRIYQAHDEAWPRQPLPPGYLDLYDRTIAFVDRQPEAYGAFDHFAFIGDFINPLFAMNHDLVERYDAHSRNVNDYSLNRDGRSIFGKSLYTAQNTKGVYSLIEDPATLSEIERVGKLLFYDPILSGNNARSCASCHKPAQAFTDTAVRTPLQFDRVQRLPRNAPSLLDATFNHLIMLDGKRLSLQEQADSVITNPIEMNGSPAEVTKKVMSCAEYRSAFSKFRRWLPEEKTVTLEHISSAITYFYGRFSGYTSPFDQAMNEHRPIDRAAQRGFNLFMGKAQCATCHFVPQFNGVKPPYISSEFEVLGVPADSAYHSLSPDVGRYDVNPAPETMHAFRTGSIRNVESTAPYMHNGVFKTLREVLDFYDGGGGVGRRLRVENQTLSADSLRLTAAEKDDLTAFMRSLKETIPFEEQPRRLPASADKRLNRRKIGGEY